MRFRQHLCEYAIKYGVTRASRRYHTNRQFVYRQLKKYDGDVRSLALKSRKPHKNPNAHNVEELGLIRRMFKRNGIYGLAEVYVRCKRNGYTRSYGKVERSHREDGKILYGRKIFISEKELKMAVKKHLQRYNSTAKLSLNFKSPNEIVSEYFSKCNICLDN